MSSDVRPEHVVLASLGLGMAIVVNRITGWWLNSGYGVAVMLSAQFVLAFLAASWKSDGQKARAIWLWAGCMSGTALVLFWVGPGTIWPLVLMIAGVATAAAVLAGVAAASMLG